MNSERPKLTRSQAKVYEYLKKYIDEKKIPPSIREICEATNLKSTSTVHSHLVNIEKKGYIERDESKNRALRIVDDLIQETLVNVPIVGTVTAGIPILAEEHIEEYFPMTMKQRKYEETFILKVSGDSMIEAGINNGDLVHVKKQNTAKNGDIVVALIEDSATVKKVYFEEEGVRLQPCNPAFTPIISKDVIILGKVISLYRTYS